MPSFAPARLSAVLARRTSVCASFFTTGILTMGKMIELTASDGHKLQAYRADPTGTNAGKPRGAIVVIQEIFGVNSHIKSVADGFAKDGYMAMKDAQAAIDAVKNVGKVGIVGYCWGGFVVWMASAKLSGLSAAVPYYG